MKFKDLTSTATKNLMKIKAGEEIRGVLRGEVEDFRQHWINNRSYICHGRDKCEHCKAGEKSSFRFRVNFIINENGAYIAKIFEQGRAVYEALKALNNDYDLEKHLIKVRRQGSGTDTTYVVVPVPNGALKPEQEKAIKAVSLNPLNVTPSESSAEPDGDDEEF